MKNDWIGTPFTSKKRLLVVECEVTSPFKVGLTFVCTSLTSPPFLHTGTHSWETTLLTGKSGQLSSKPYINHRHHQSDWLSNRKSIQWNTFNRRKEVKGDQHPAMSKVNDSFKVSQFTMSVNGKKNLSLSRVWMMAMKPTSQCKRMWNDTIHTHKYTIRHSSQIK